MFLIIQTVLLVLSSRDSMFPAVEGMMYPLDMAENSVDDQYDGCTMNMANLVNTKYLQKELDDSVEFRNGWKEAVNNSKAPEDNLTKNHSIAIYVYTNLDSGVYGELNAAVRNGRQSYTNQTFQWYSLHFLLTDAIQILSESQRKCKTTYRGTKAEFYKNVTGNVIRFGSFTSSSLNRRVAQGFGKKSCFKIKTCYGANVVKYSKYRDQKEVLIPPYETFKVTSVKTKGAHGDLWCDTVYSLKSKGVRSDLNCAIALRRFTKNAAMHRFCRCFYQKVHAISQAVKQGFYVRISLTRSLSISRNTKMKAPSNGEEVNEKCINVFQSLVPNQTNVRECCVWQEIGQRQSCLGFLNSLGFDPLILELLKPCCGA